MADIVLGQYGSEFICSLQFWKWIMLQSIAKVFEFCETVITVKKNFHEIELVDAWKWILKTKYWNSADITE